MRTLQGSGPPGDNEVFGLTIDDDHSYAMWDAPYVLGSLSAGDRREFEAHMAGCPSCRQAVGELSGVPALLSQLDRADVAAISESGPARELSPQLLPSLLATVRRSRRRSRVATWVASAAAAAVLGAGVFVGAQGYSTSPPPQQQLTAIEQPMSQVSTNLLTSTVSVSAEHWGTSIRLRCVCLAPPGASRDRLAMVVVGHDGSKTQLATWVAEPGHTATPVGSISTPVDQISAVQVVSADTGQVLLQRSL